MLLVDEVNVTDPSARRLRHERVVESGSLLCNLGSSLLAPPQELAWEKHRMMLVVQCSYPQQGKIGYSHITLGCKQVSEQEGA